MNFRRFSEQLPLDFGREKYAALMESALPRVLAVSNRQLSTNMERDLSQLGFEMRTVSNQQLAATAIREWAPEAVLLESPLYGVDAFSLITSLRTMTDLPVLMLSTVYKAGQKICALTRGADDYILEPFDWEEIAACISARLRRPRIQVREFANYADLSIDITQRRAYRAGIPIDLSVREFDLLLTLVRHSEHVLTRSQLLDLVWGTDRDITLENVTTYISYVRSKIEALGEPLIQTVRGLGYTMRMQSSPM